MKEPTFSVIMPAHNRARMICDAIASVLAQTRSDFELLVIDDGSTDGTADLVRQFTSDERVRVLQRNERSGPGAARNAGIARARAPYVCMLDSDDLWLPRYLETVGPVLEQNPDAGLACTGYWVLDEPPGRIRRSAMWKLPATFLDAEAFLQRLAHLNFVVNSTVTLRRSVLNAVGGCNPDLPAAIDFDLWLRVAAAGWGAVCSADPLTVYRVHRNSLQFNPSNESRVWLAGRTVYLALAEEWDVSPEVKRIARNRVEEIDRHLETLSGQRRMAHALLRARRRVSPLKRLLLRRWLWFREPPFDLANRGVDGMAGS